MGRLIKFRAWDSKRKEMCVVSQIGFGPYGNEKGDNKHRILAVEGYGVTNTPYRDLDKDDPLMQFTGLTDKNGKEIYEGDIVRGTAGIGEVKWSSDRFLADFGTQKLSLASGFEKEVIGNIHENKELLK